MVTSTLCRSLVKKFGSSMVCSWFRDAAGWMLGSVTWIFSLGSVLGGSSSVCFCSVPWLFGPGGVVERKSFLSAFWPVAAKALDAATRKSALSKNLRFFSHSRFQQGF